MNYSRRINRPNFWQLFPFIDYTDSLNISRGNPDLNPEFTNSIELSFSQLFKNRDNLIASVYFKNTNNLITRILNPEFDTILNKNVFVSSFANANRSYVTGLELTSRNKLAKWWELTSNANFFTSKIDLDTLPDPDQFFSYFFKLNNTFRLPNNFSIQLSGDYQSRIVSRPEAQVETAEVVAAAEVVVCLGAATMQPRRGLYDPTTVWMPLSGMSF
jgi:outer membrane receptor protein involved in Fe transport